MLRYWFVVAGLAARWLLNVAGCCNDAGYVDFKGSRWDEALASG